MGSELGAEEKLEVLGAAGVPVAAGGPGEVGVPVAVGVPVCVPGDVGVPLVVSVATFGSSMGAPEDVEAVLWEMAADGSTVDGLAVVS